MVRRFAVLSGMVMLLSWVTGGTAAEPPTDSLMGDWQGTVKTADGERPLYAQVICWGNGQYQANLLETLAKRVKPLAVWKAKIHDGVVAFAEGVQLSEGSFTGKLSGEVAGEFSLKPFKRTSPTMGAKPPAGAVVLFDGANVDQLDHQTGSAWAISLGRLMRGENRVGYLRCRLLTEKATPARIEFGAGEWVKVWLNGQALYTSEKPGKYTPWSNKIEVDLQAGANTLLLKLAREKGAFNACVRVRSRAGKPLDGLKTEPALQLTDPVLIARANGGDPSVIVPWEVAGPYSVKGKKGSELFALSFPPEETDQSKVKWRPINQDPSTVHDWRLTDDGALEVYPRSGNMVTKRQFADVKLHVEFRSPFMPTATGQARGNSGVKLQNTYEAQVLDSYGLSGENNECGGIYKVSKPLVNMCFPPGQWQTYDIDFVAPRRDKETGQVTDAIMTVVHNGVLIQDKVHIKARTRPGEDGIARGPIQFQDHGNKVQYRNIWVVEQKAAVPK